jgi:hypothetical protein
LIAATALGLLHVRYVLVLNLLAISLPVGDPTARLTWFKTMVIGFSSPVLIALSMGVFVISLRRPRPPLRCLAREPGFVAMAVIVMTTVYYLFHLAIRAISNYYSTLSPSLYSSHYLHIFGNIFIAAGFNVAVAWFVLALQGNWRPRSIWAGGLSAALGCTWVAIRVLDDFYYIFRMIYIDNF